MSTDADWTVRRILEWTTDHLTRKGSETPRLDAEILLAFTRGCKRIDLYTRYDELLDDRQRATMRDLVRRRANAEPVAYLVGHREFFSLDFRVTPDVLIPRPDTETLVVELLDRAKRIDAPRIVDVGVGSGCIAVTAAKHLPKATVTAIDVSPAALAIARENAEKHGVAARMRFLAGDLFAPLAADERFDFVVSNPPYVAEAELETLQLEVHKHEPRIALVGGKDGLEIVRRLIAAAPSRLEPGGSLLIEVSPEQAEPVRRELESRAADFAEPKILKDLSGHPRIVAAVRN